MIDPKKQMVFRTFGIPEDLRAAMTASRKARKQTVRDFIRLAVERELQKLVGRLEREMPNPAGRKRRPARLPMTEELLAELRRASQRTGLPAVRLLLACLGRAARKKKR